MDLSQEQQEILLNYQAITENWDTISALETLNRNHWDLALATSEFFGETNNLESRFPEENYFSPQPHPFFERNSLPNGRNPPIVSRNSAQVPRPTQPKPTNKPGLFSKLKSMFSEIISTPVPIYSSAAEDFHKKLLSQSQEFIPNFGRNLLKDMIEEAKQKKKILLMYIDSENSPPDYLAQVFCNELSSMIINDYYIGWGVSKDSAEGSKIANEVLKAQDFPCVAAVRCDNSTGPLVVEKLEGVQSPEKIIEFLSRNYVTRPILSQKEKVLEEERKIRAKQDRELKEAERIVKLKQIEEQKKKDDERKRIEEEKIRAENKEKENKRKIENIGEEAVGENAAFVSFRLPNGSKIERKFFKDQKVGVLFDFLEVQGLENFEILFGFPSAIINDKEITIEESGIFPKAVVIVRKSESA